jgi:hypothetical protein
VPAIHIEIDRIAELIFKILTATGSGYPLGVERCVEKEVTNCDFEPKDVRGVWVRCARDKSHWNKLNTPNSVYGQNERRDKLTGYQDCAGLNKATTRIDGWIKYIIAFGVGTVGLGIIGVRFSAPLVLV